MALHRVCVELGANCDAGVGLTVDPARQGGQEMGRQGHHAQVFHSLQALAIAVSRILARRSSFRIVRRNSGFRGQCAHEYTIRRPRSPKDGVQWHETGLLMERGEGRRR